METNDLQDSFPKIEINIANTNPNSQIVLNDLRLLELLYKYPFLISKAVEPQDDEDYEEWGWEQIAKFFNQGYEGFKLSAPFSVEELQWRWKILRPLCPSLAKASHQIPESLCKVIESINQTMEVPPPHKENTLSAAQTFLLSQMSLVEQLSREQQRCLEVDVLDAIFNAERNGRAIEELKPEDMDIVNQEYHNFLQTVQLKDVPKDLRTKKKNSFCSEIENSEPAIVNNKESNLVISSVRGMQPPEEDENMEELDELHEMEKRKRFEVEHVERFEVEPVKRFGLEPAEHFEATKRDVKPDELLEEDLLEPLQDKSEEHLRVELEPLEIHEVEEHLQAPQQPKRRRGRPKRQVTLVSKPKIPNNLQLRFVPLKSAKYYVKKVRVRLKRFDLDEYLPLANFKNSRSRSTSATLSV